VTSSGSCPLCQIAASREGVIFEDDTWLVRSTSSTPAVAGWLILQTRRHIGDPADFDANEAASFGSMLQRFAHLLREITGALRIYTGSLNEGSPHFHCHLLPRLPRQGFFVELALHVNSQHQLADLHLDRIFLRRRMFMPRRALRATPR
jgi:diadenosine tetraphosphate (Ap4A) HIT family hydrolase